VEHVVKAGEGWGQLQAVCYRANPLDDAKWSDKLGGKLARKWWWQREVLRRQQHKVIGSKLHAAPMLVGVSHSILVGALDVSTHNRIGMRAGAHQRLNGLNRTVLSLRESRVDRELRMTEEDGVEGAMLSDLVCAGV
jgi:hypothetical protein